MLRYRTRLVCAGLISLFLAVAVFQMILAAPAYGADRQIRNDNIQPEKILFHSDFKTPQIVSGQFVINTAGSRQDKAYEFFSAKSDLYQIAAPREELELVKNVTDNLGLTHLRFQQRFQGLQVWGCQTIVHFREDNSIYLAGGQTIPTPDFSINPALNEAEAAIKAVSDLKNDDLPGQTATSSELIVYPNSGDPRLAWLVTVTSPSNGGIRWRVFVDAQSGQILNKFNDIHFDGPDTGSGLDLYGVNQTFPIYFRNSEYQMIDATRTMYVPPIDNLQGVIVTYDNYYAGGPISADLNGDKIWNDAPGQAAAVSGHHNAILSFEYFYDTFGRNSIDDAGMTVLVNVHDPYYVNNAYWNGEGINFADGDGVNFLPFAGALDVVAHELTHGVTEYTAGLIYQFMSGALSEHFSDFFGAMVDRDDWTNGESITLFSPGFIRSMEDPTLRGHPKHMSNYINYEYETDNGGVHVNCGIPNHAAYQACNLLSREIGEQIWYRNLTTYMTPLSDFYFWAGMTMQSTKDLYGTTEIDAINDALDSVGLNTTYAIPYFAQAAATLGNTGNTTVTIHNPGPGAKQVTPVAPSIPGLTVSPDYQVEIPEDDFYDFTLTLDAASLDGCDIGYSQDSLRFDVAGSISAQLKLPLTAVVGINDASTQLADLQTTCLSATVNNTGAMLGFGESGDVLARGSFMAGWSDYNGPDVYRDIFGTVKFSPADLITQTDEERSFLYTSYDARIQGTVTYRFPNDLGDTCDFVIADYTIHNPCNSPTTLYSGALFDFDISTYSDYGNYDVGSNMVYMYDEGDNTACGLALLTGEARNLRALKNDDILENGFSDQVALTQLSSTFNLDGTDPSDWSILLSFGQDILNPGDTATYSVAIMYSGTGSAGLADILAQAEAWNNRVPFICGNTNGDQSVNVGDVVFLVNLIFHDGPGPEPQAAGDVNCDGNVNIGDAVYLGNYVFQEGAPVPCAGCPVK